MAFEGGVTFPNGTSVTASSDTTLGTTADDLLLVKAAALFEAGLQVLDELRVDGLLAVAGDVELGNSSSDYLLVHAASTFTGPVSLYSTAQCWQARQCCAFSAGSALQLWSQGLC